MNINLTSEQISSYRNEDFLLIENFLNTEELNFWRNAVTEAIDERGGRKFPKEEMKTGEHDGINKEADYYGKVFDQMINMWQSNEKMHKIMTDEKIGKMAADLAGWEGTCIWHDQTLIKRPWANPTSWHLDTPFWSFSD